MLDNDAVYETHHGESVDVLPTLDPGTVDLCWTDPPFNTGDKQSLGGNSYDDRYDSIGDYLTAMETVFALVEPLMAPHGVVCVCLDYRAVHDVKVRVLDVVFGRDRFMGEIIWHSQLGNTSKRWWSNKHNTILTYAVDDSPTFNLHAVPTTDRLAPRGGYTSATRPVNSVWPITLSPTASERVQYPNQKPLDLIRPFINVHTNRGGIVLDPFMGSGSTLVAALQARRRAVGVDRNEEAFRVANGRCDKEMMQQTHPYQQRVLGSVT